MTNEEILTIKLAIDVLRGNGKYREVMTRMNQTEGILIDLINNGASPHIEAYIPEEEIYTHYPYKGHH